MGLLFVALVWTKDWDILLIKLENSASEIKKEAVLIQEISSALNKSDTVERIPELIHTIQKLDQKLQNSEEIFKKLEND